MIVLVINCGSSSVKFEVLDTGEGRSLAAGKIERIGEGKSHPEAIQEVLASVREHAIEAVGHRVVHGADRFSDPVVIDGEVIAAIEACIPLAPLHNPANLAGIRAAMEALSDVRRRRRTGGPGRPARPAGKGLYRLSDSIHPLRRVSRDRRVLGGRGHRARSLDISDFHRCRDSGPAGAESAGARHLRASCRLLPEVGPPRALQGSLGMPVRAGPKQRRSPAHEAERTGLAANDDAERLDKREDVLAESVRQARVVRHITAAHRGAENRTCSGFRTGSQTRRGFPGRFFRLRVPARDVQTPLPVVASDRRVRLGNRQRSTDQ